MLKYENVWLVAKICLLFPDFGVAHPYENSTCVIFVMMETSFACPHDTTAEEPASCETYVERLEWPHKTPTSIVGDWNTSAIQLQTLKTRKLGEQQLNFTRILLQSNNVSPRKWTQKIVLIEMKELAIFTETKQLKFFYVPYSIRTIGDVIIKLVIFFVMNEDEIFHIF